MGARRHVVRTGLTAIIIASTSVGCWSDPKPEEAVRPNREVVPPSDAQPNGASPHIAADTAQQQAAQPLTPEELAQRTATYAQTMKPLIRERKPAPQTMTQREIETPSLVDWISPDDFRIAPEQEPRPVTKVEPPAVVVEKPAAPTVIDTRAPIANAQTANVVQQQPVASNVQTPVHPDGGDNALATANHVVALTPKNDTGVVGTNVPTAVLASSVEEPATSTPADNLSKKFSDAVTNNPRDLSCHLDFQLYQFLREEQVPELTSLTPLPAEDRELVSAVMDGLSNFRTNLRSDNNMLLSKKIQPILEMADRLRSGAELTIPTLALCTRVDGFGTYEPINPARFIAGKEHSVIVYAEVENFSSTLNDNKQWETKLNQEAVLYTENGLPVWEDKTKSMTDVSRNRRHDFFSVKIIKFPANLTIGRYLLKVSITDQQASRVAESTVEIQIVAQ